MIAFELYGAPRLRAGVGRVQVDATTFGDALEALAELCPALDGPVIVGRSLHPAYKVSLNGDRFLDDPEMSLPEGSSLLLISADAGG